MPSHPILLASHSHAIAMDHNWVGVGENLIK